MPFTPHRALSRAIGSKYAPAAQAARTAVAKLTS
jgi:hypothetical protein